MPFGFKFWRERQMKTLKFYDDVVDASACFRR